jgi:hypothetical protein
MNRLMKLMCLAILSTTAATPAFAASDGDIGSTSTGSSTISVTVPELAKISKVDNLVGGTYTPPSGSSPTLGLGFDMNDDVCIYSNASTDSYRVTLTGNYDSSGSAGTDFYVKGSSSGDTIAYAVYWNDVTGTSGETSATAGTAITGQTGYANTWNCGGGSSTNANFHVTMTDADMLAKHADAYSGTLTIVIAPN